MTTHNHESLTITVTDQEHCKKQLQIEIPAEMVRSETDRIAADFAKQVNVSGFRRGRVPKSIVKTRFRKELRDEMLSHLLPHALGDAIREKDLKVLGEPSIDDLKFGEDESINVTFTVEVAPEFELADYKNLSVTKRVYKVEDGDVEKTIDRLREAQAELVPVEDRGAQAGDIVTINITGRITPPAQEADKVESGEAASAEGASSTPDESTVPTEQPQADEEIKQQDLDIEIGGEGVLKEFTEALMDARPGETRTFTVDYPPDYSNKRFAGYHSTYSAEVSAVRVKEMPEVDDDFAQSIGEEFKTRDELQASVRSNLEHEMSHKSEEELRSAVIEQLIDGNKFEVPQVIIEKQMDTRLNVFFRQLASQGIDPRNLKLDWDSMRETHRERAEREVRGMFILDRIAKNENIEVSEEELNKEIEGYANSTGQPLEVLKARLTKDDALDSIKEQIRNRKALDLVIASADTRIEEVAGSGGPDAAAGDESGEAAGQAESPK